MNKISDLLSKAVGVDFNKKDENIEKDVKVEAVTANSEESIKNDTFDTYPANSTTVATTVASTAADVSARMKLVEPTKISECVQVCDELKNGRIVVMNLEKLDQADKLRLCDFISGATYVLCGKIKEISDNVFVVAPQNVDVQASVYEEATSSMDDSKYNY